MKIQNSPLLRVIDPREAGDADVVGIGEDLSVEMLTWAYGHGIFPWPISGYPLLWFCPPQRAILDFGDLHVPRRLARARRQTLLHFTINQAFLPVIDACRRIARPGERRTWITPAMRQAYAALHDTGNAHSIEAWDGAGHLVGGLYGVSVGGAFSGESMFHFVPDASKLALLHLIEHLASRGLDWVDIQMMTPHLAALGAKLIARENFLDRLAATQQKSLSLFTHS